MLKRIYNFLFKSCDHNWKIIHSSKLVMNDKQIIPHGYKYILQCEKCGNIKAKTIR